MSDELSLMEEDTTDVDIWQYLNETVCDIPELENMTGIENIIFRTVIILIRFVVIFRTSNDVSREARRRRRGELEYRISFWFVWFLRSHLVNDNLILSSLCPQLTGIINL